MNAVVVRLSDLAFLSPADLSGACSESELGEKILKGSLNNQFFLFWAAV
jgi:hypothetical protein